MYLKTTKPPNEIVNYNKKHMKQTKVEEYNEISLFTDSFLENADTTHLMTKAQKTKHT